MSYNILVIDDDIDFVKSLTSVLETNQYKVIQALTGTEALEKAKKAPPDIILLDMVLSYDREGKKVAQAFASDPLTSHTPIILITGANVNCEKEKLPVKTVVNKPVNPQELLKMIETHLKNQTDQKEMTDKIYEIIEKWMDKAGNLIMILHEIQNFYGYVPRIASFQLSKSLNIPIARIYEVITFYNFFKLEPPGQHTISVCMGTACYLKGAPKLIEELKNLLNISENETTKDGMFHLQVVRCLGCCGLAPVIMVDEKIYGKVTKDQLPDILSKYVKEKGILQHEKTNA